MSEKLTEADVLFYEKRASQGSVIAAAAMLAFCREWREQRSALADKDQLIEEWQERARSQAKLVEMYRRSLEAKAPEIKELVDDVCLWRSRAEAMERWAEEVQEASKALIEQADIADAQPASPLFTIPVRWCHALRSVLSRRPQPKEPI